MRPTLTNVAWRAVQNGMEKMRRLAFAFRMLGQVPGRARAAAAFGQLLQAALARRQHRHFGHGEESVAQDQDQDDQQLQHVVDAGAPLRGDIEGTEPFVRARQPRQDSRGDIGRVNEIARLAAVAPDLDRPLALNDPADEGRHKMG